MASIEELLKRHIDGATQNFRAADADLHQAVAAASEGVAKLADGVALELSLSGEDLEGVTYLLKLRFPAGGTELGFFRVPSSGYPIKFANHPAHFAGGSSLQNPTDLAGVFQKLASNPDSM